MSTAHKFAVASCLAFFAMAEHAALISDDECESSGSECSAQLLQSRAAKADREASAIGPCAEGQDPSMELQRTWGITLGDQNCKRKHESNYWFYICNWQGETWGCDSCSAFSSAEPSLKRQESLNAHLYAELATFCDSADDSAAHWHTAHEPFDACTGLKRRL
eukprot:s3704_g3.t1